MNDLGPMLAWSAVQVSLVLAAAVVVHGVAARRSPASGAWVASVGLGLALAVGVLSLALRARASAPPESIVASQVLATRSNSATSAPTGHGHEPDGPAAAARPRLTMAMLAALWTRLERSAAEPAVRCRPWGRLLAIVGLTGACAGMLRLIAGLWAVHRIRTRTRPVDDPELARLLAEISTSIRCPRKVELREAPDLISPATAGWTSAVILLPGDWRSWDDDERRAVLAHELAHVCRDDYVIGVIARAALALYFYHPLVHWLAARLWLEQELAADALGARFAGGKTRYLRSLSRLALRQDGRLPCWPARAFLPVHGTLIRRIAMLREDSKASDRPWSGQSRALAASLLLAVAAGASLLHGPARADDRDVPAAPGSPEYVLGELTITGTERNPVKPFNLSYVADDSSQGFVAVRPAAAFRRSGMAVYRTMLNLLIGQQWSKLANERKFDATKPGQTPLRIEMFEEVTACVRIWRTDGPKPNGRLAIGTVFTARTTEPIDWPTLFRAFRQEPVEARDGSRVYYKVKSRELGPDGAFFCPDDRTLVLAPEKRILEFLRRTAPPPAPALAQGKDFDTLNRGLLVVALDNRGGRLSKAINEDEPEDDDIDPRPIFEHADYWTFGVDDDDQLVFRGVGTCPDGGASEATVRAIRGLLAGVRKQIGQATPSQKDGEVKAYRMGLEFFDKMRIERQDRSVLITSAGMGTFADIAALVAAGVFKP